MAAPEVAAEARKQAKVATKREARRQAASPVVERGVGTLAWEVAAP